MSVEPFVAFYRQYYRLVLTIAHQRLGSFLDAEDAAAETFRIAWQGHKAGRELSLPWLYQVLRNVVGNAYRHRGRASDGGERLAVESYRVDAVAPPVDEGVEMRMRIAELPEPDRELIYMAYWEGLTGSEIGQILGCSAGAVRVRLLRARKKLKAMIDGQANREVGEVHHG